MFDSTRERQESGAEDSVENEPRYRGDTQPKNCHSSEVSDESNQQTEETDEHSELNLKIHLVVCIPIEKDLPRGLS